MNGRHEPEIPDERGGPGAESRIARSRSELEGVLVDRALDPAFPRSHTMRALHQHGPLLMAGIAAGLMLVKPHWGRRVVRMLPMLRMLKRLNHD
jgi:hypothetical protein